MLLRILLMYWTRRVCILKVVTFLRKILYNNIPRVSAFQTGFEGYSS